MIMNRFPGGGVDVSAATAQPSDVLAPQTYFGGEDEEIHTGTLALTGDALPSDVLAGKGFYRNNAKVKEIGTAPAKAAQTYTPGTTNQIIASGQHLTGAQTIAGSSNLVPGNIKPGVQIFGVTGAAYPSIDANFAYTGRKRYERRVMNGVLYHLLIFETSGTLTVSGSWTGDVWLCGAGAAPTNYAGGGGYTTNATNRSITSGAITIGASNSAVGGSSSYSGLSAAGGNYQNGGCGGGETVNTASGYKYAAGTGQGSTTRPFASSDMPPMCGGAAGAGDRYSWPGQGGNGGSDGSNGGAYNSSGTVDAPGNPGLYGGGIAGNYLYKGDIARLAYGGGAHAATTGGGYGGTGCVMIRIAA